MDTQNRERNRLLLVEDEEELGNLISEWLQLKNFQVTYARNTTEAILIWLKNRETIDLIVSDLRLPGIISGPDMVQKFLEERRDTKIVLMSGFSLDHFDLPFLTLRNFIQKPFQLQALAELIERNLEKTAAA